MKREPPKGLLEAIRELAPLPLGVLLTETFHRMVLAEDEITAAKKRYPDKADAIHGAFRYLRPSELLRGKADDVFRAHCRELLARVAGEKDLRPGTAAELVALFSEMSQATLLDRTATLLYSKLFQEVFPGKSDAILKAAGPMEPDHTDRRMMWELEVTLRRKLATDRGAEDSETQPAKPCRSRVG